MGGVFKVILKKEKTERKELEGLGEVVYVFPEEESQGDTEAKRKSKEIADKLFRTPPDGFIIPNEKGGYDCLELSEEEKQAFAKEMGWAKDK